jgi:hypothetical protein
MRELAGLLMRAGHSARAPIILEEAGKAPTEQDFADAARIAEALCAGKENGKRKVSVARNDIFLVNVLNLSTLGGQAAVRKKKGLLQSNY